MNIEKLMVDQEVISNIKNIWNFTRLHQKIEPCDIIFACGCSNLDIPVKCAELFKSGYGKKILFAGGLGKITSSKFKKSEAEVYRDIAVQCGVPDEAILLETKSTNTGDNFRFSKKLLYQNQVKRILLVHYATSERRTLSAAKAILPEFHFIITSPELTFEDFLEKLRQSPEYFYKEVSLLVGDIQRLVIYPQLGWQEKVDIPESIIHTYFFLKNKGFDKFIYSSSDILDLVKKYKSDLQNPNLFS